MHPWTLVRECAAALVSGGSLGVVVAPDPGEVDFSDLVPLDAYKYPMLRVPAACATEVLKLTAHVVSLADAGLDVTVTGTACAAVVAAYAAACARSALAHRGTKPLVSSIAFGMPLCVDAPALGAVHVALASDARCMYPPGPSRRTIWLGNRGAGHYAARAFAYVIPPDPDAGADAQAYADAVRDAPLADDEWHFVGV
jgi:hypothetical protein